MEQARALVERQGRLHLCHKVAVLPHGSAEGIKVAGARVPSLEALSQ